MTQTRGHWHSRIGFIWAAAGSAVGLGNIWRFPYLAGENGGSMFVLVYLACVLLIGLPIMIGEVTIGKAGQRNPIGAFRILAGEKSWWLYVGFMGLAAAFVILSFYSLVAGWCIDFIWKAATGVFQPGHTMEEVSALFKELTGDPKQQALFQAIFMVLTIGIVAAGVQKGLERWNEILMPLLILILLALAGYAWTQPGAGKGLEFLMKPDPTKLTGRAILTAMGQCFFSLSLGMGAMMTYGSYLRAEQRVPTSVVWVIVMDTLLALLAGFVVFPLVFSFGQEPGQGPGLVFVTLPAAFLKMPGGTWVALSFFVLLLFAALTSAISLLEVVTAYFVDEYKMPRRQATVMFGSVCFLTGLGCAFSLDYLDVLDKLQGNYLLPLGGLLIAVFAGWRLDRRHAEHDFAGTWYAGLFGVWRFCVRFVAPALVAVVFLNALGVFDLFLQ